MSDALLQKITEALDLAQTRRNRLVVVIYPPGSIVNGDFQALSGIEQRFAYVNFNLAVSHRLLDSAGSSSQIELLDILRELLAGTKAEVVWLDHLGILFDPAFKHDPLRLLEALSRNTSLVVAWEGLVQGNNLIYAEPDHPEYRRYNIADHLVVRA
jgi:hypothetical protein